MKKPMPDPVVAARDAQTNDGEEPYDAELSARRPSFVVGVTPLRGGLRRYDVDIRHPDGQAWKRITAQIVCDPFGPQYVDVDGWQMYVCLCKAGAVGRGYHHTCHEARSDAEWIATAVERYLTVHPEKFIPELRSLLASGRPS